MLPNGLFGIAHFMYIDRFDVTFSSVPLTLKQRDKRQNLRLMGLFLLQLLRKRHMKLLLMLNEWE